MLSRVSFAYDPFGRRIKKVSSAGTSIYAYDSDNLVEETNSSGIRRFEARSGEASEGAGEGEQQPILIRNRACFGTKETKMNMALDRRRNTARLLETATALVCVLLAVLSASSAVMLAQSSANGGTVYVGILDDAREHAWHGKADADELRLVMPAFEKAGTEWHSISSFSPLEMKWTISFDGKDLGEIETHANTEEGGADELSSPESRAKQSIVTRAASVPVVGKPSRNFTGASFLVGLKTVHRPLVAVSKPYYRDPDGWKRTQLPEKIAALVRTGFRDHYPHVDRCEQEAVVEHDWKYPDSAVTLPNAYTSNKNSFLVAVRLNAGDCGWGGRPDDPADPWVLQWFLVAPDGNVHRVGGFEELLDAGDYDNDGRSEIIFFSTRSEHSDAYDLLYGDDLQKRATLVIGYR